MKATTLPALPDAKSPAGADIRYIMDGETGNMIHCTVPPHQTNKDTVHATVSEFWYVLEGRWPRERCHSARSGHIGRHSGRNIISVPEHS